MIPIERIRQQIDFLDWKPRYSKVFKDWDLTSGIPDFVRVRLRAGGSFHDSYETEAEAALDLEQALATILADLGFT